MQIGQVVQEPFKGWEVKKMTSQDISGIPYRPHGHGNVAKLL